MFEKEERFLILNESDDGKDLKAIFLKEKIILHNQPRWANGLRKQPIKDGNKSNSSLSEETQLFLSLEIILKLQKVLLLLTELRLPGRLERFNKCSMTTI